MTQTIDNHICGNCRNYIGGIYGRCRIYNYAQVALNTNGNACIDYTAKGGYRK